MYARVWCLQAKHSQVDEIGRVSFLQTPVRAGSNVSDVEDLSHQEQLDAILDKIKESGYESLNREEKEFLFNASKK